MTPKKLFLCLLLLSSSIPSVAFGAVNTDTIFAIGSAPAGDAVNGSMIESTTPDGNYSPNEINDSVVLTQPYLLIVDGNSSETNSGAPSIVFVSDAVFSLPPDGQFSVCVAGSATIASISVEAIVVVSDGPATVREPISPTVNVIVRDIM